MTGMPLEYGELVRGMLQRAAQANLEAAEVGLVNVAIAVEIT